MPGVPPACSWPVHDLLRSPMRPMGFPVFCTAAAPLAGLALVGPTDATLSAQTDVRTVLSLLRVYQSRLPLFSSIFSPSYLLPLLLASFNCVWPHQCSVLHHTLPHPPTLAPGLCYCLFLTSTLHTPLSHTHTHTHTYSRQRFGHPRAHAPSRASHRSSPSLHLSCVSAAVRSRNPSPPAPAHRRTTDLTGQITATPSSPSDSDPVTSDLWVSFS